MPELVGSDIHREVGETEILFQQKLYASHREAFAIGLDQDGILGARRRCKVVFEEINAFVYFCFGG